MQSVPHANVLRDISPPLSISDVELAIAFRRQDASALLECACRFCLGEQVMPDIGKAIGLLRQLTAKGNSTAKCLLGTLMLDVPGQFGIAPRKRSVTLMKEAAASGHIPARVQFFRLVVETSSLANHLPDAVEWICQAAVSGHRDALYELGVLYDQGTVLERDLGQSQNCFVKAAELGDFDAAFNAGLGYVLGEGVRKNLRRAKALFEQAAAGGHRDALYELGLLCDSKSASRLWGVAPGSEELAFRAAEYYRQSAELGSPLAQVNYAVHCINGDGIPADPVTGVNMYALAAIQGDPQGCAGLGNCLLDGTGVEPDADEGQAWLEFVS